MRTLDIAAEGQPCPAEPPYTHGQAALQSAAAVLLSNHGLNIGACLVKFDGRIGRRRLLIEAMVSRLLVVSGLPMASAASSMVPAQQHAECHPSHDGTCSQTPMRPALSAPAAGSAAPAPQQKPAVAPPIDTLSVNAYGGVSRDAGSETCLLQRAYMQQQQQVLPAFIGHGSRRNSN